jgi:hypothetical protein
MNNNEQFYLARTLEKIEFQFDRGGSDKWSTYDFEKLSDAIFERTQVRLSVTTLKRIWGKLKYDSAPTLTTLNTLAQFAGYADWRDFTQSEDRPGDPQAVPDEPQPNPKRKSRRLVATLAGTLVLIVGLYFLFLSARQKQTHYDPAQFEFSANKIMTEGVPNSVIFHYAVPRERGMKPDSLFIVQTWDMTRKKLVSSDGREHSAIYYYPGYFKTKLIADGQVVKSHDLWITSGGWLCLLEDNPVPVYFKKKESQKNDIVEVSEAMLAPHRHSSSTQRVRIFNQRNMGNLMNDNFTFETMVKNEFDDGTNACHKTQVLIQCKNDVIIIPLAAKACVGDLSLYFCGAEAASRSADLSGFGCDLTQWTSLRVETVNRTATIFVNNKKAYTLTFPNDPTGIVGVQYRFNGAAAVKDTRFVAGGKVYEME